MTPAAARERFSTGRVAVLGTIADGGQPHLVPVTFAVAGGAVWTAVDGKPKRGAALARLANIRARPAVSLLVQNWDENWSALWWVRADGLARVLDGEDDVAHAAASLAGKYPQYAEVAVSGPVIAVAVTGWRWWAAAG